MGLGGLLAGNESRIDRELKHHESVLEQGLAEARVVAPVLHRLDRQVVHGDQPHTSVGGEIESSWQGTSVWGRSSFSSLPAITFASEPATRKRMSESARSSLFTQYRMVTASINHFFAKAFSGAAGSLFAIQAATRRSMIGRNGSMRSAARQKGS